MKNLGDLFYFLGIQVQQSSDRLFLDQKGYLVNLSKNNDFDNLWSSPTKYCWIVGALHYLLLILPDISYSVNRLSIHGCTLTITLVDHEERTLISLWYSAYARVQPTTIDQLPPRLSFAAMQHHSRRSPSELGILSELGITIITIYVIIKVRPTSHPTLYTERR